MTYRAETMSDVRYRTLARNLTGQADRQAMYAQRWAIIHAYNAGATLQQLADATGLTRQRIQQIVTERGER